MHKPPSESHSRLSRRTLFAGAGTVGALAAAVSLMPGATPEAPPEAAAPRPAPERGGGYALTDHVKHYYKTTQICAPVPEDFLVSNMWVSGALRSGWACSCA
jgi:hypothetical protein